MRGRSRFIEIINIVKVSTVSILLMTAVTFFYREYSYSRIVFIIFWITSSIGLTITHFAIRKILSEMRKKGKNVRHVIIIGDGELAQTLSHKISLHPEIGFFNQGFITTNPENEGKIFEGIAVLGQIENITEIIHKNTPDQILIAIPMEEYGRLNSIIESLRDETADIKIVPDLLRFMKINPGIEDFDGLPVVNISESPLYGWNSIAKRCMDIILTLLLITISLPLMGLIGIIIKLTSAGPLIFKQERMGMDGDKFFIYKFRTMPVDAEAQTGPIWAKKDDDRRTSIGAFLRKTSLDELPQLFNVLGGEMSLVGPRPERPVYVEEFRQSIPKYMLRHKIKAGMTGWAQINGYRGNTSITKRIEHDLHYIDNWSIKFDLKILFLTIFKGFSHPHAY